MSIRIDAVVPGSDRIGGGVAAIILGAGFVATPGVTFGGTAATSVVLVSATKLTCVVPAHAAGAVNVVVTNPDTTTSTLTNGFTFYTPASRNTALVNDIGGVSMAVRHDSPSPVAVTQSATQGQATFAVDDTPPVPFTPVRFGLGSLADADLLFRGKIQTIPQSHEDTGDNPIWTGTAVDLRAEFNRGLVFESYVGVNADVVLLDIIAKSCPDFTGAHVVAGLDPITVTFDGAIPEDCGNQIADLIGGYFYWDKSYDVHLFITESPALTPDALDYQNTTLLNDPALVFTPDVTQFRNQVVGFGASVQALRDTAIGSTTLALQADIFGASGTVHLAGSAQLVTYTGKGQAYAADPPTTWIAAAPISGVWTSVCWSPQLGLFVAVAQNTAMTSPDGVTWTVRTIPTGAYNGVTWSPGLTLFVAVGSSGVVATSPDGTTWTSRTAAGTAENWSSVCWSPTLALFVATGSKASTYAVMTSPDGTTWTGRTAAVTTIPWVKVVWADALSLLVSCSSSGANSIMTSPDGTTWTTRTGPGATTVLAWSHELSLLVAISGATSYTSPNGTAWTTHASALPTASWRESVWSDAGWFVATSDNATSLIAISPDGITWTTFAAPGSVSTWRGLAWAPAIGTLVGIGSNASSVATAMLNTTTVVPALVGIPPSGAGAIATAINAGDAVGLYSVRNNLTSQAAVAAIEGRKSTGVYSFVCPDTSSFVTQTSLDARCDADLFQYSDSGGILKVDYTCLDPKSGYGKPLHVDLLKYRDAVMKNGPLGYWRLGDTVGSPTVVDSSGHGSTGTIAGGVTLGSAGAIGDGDTAALFNGTTGNIARAGGYDPLSGLTAVTLEAWVNHNGAAWSGSYEAIVDFAANNQFLAVLNGVSNPGLKISGTLTQVNGGTVQTTGWHHLVVTWKSGDKIRSYVDRQQVAASASPITGSLDSSPALMIGAFSGPLSFLNGSIDEVAAYGSCLTPDDITNNYNLGPVPDRRLLGDFIIQTVNISNIDEDMNDLAPRYACMALSKRMALTTEDLLRHVIK